MQRWLMVGLVVAAGCGGAGAAVDAPVLIDSPAGPGAGEPNLFAAGDGTVYMSWLEPADSSGEAGSTRHGDFALRFSVLAPAGTWSDVRTVTRGSDLFVNWADFPSIVRTAGGTLVAHWLQRTGGNTYAYAVRTATSRDGGASWSEPGTPHGDDTPTEHGFVSLLPRDDGSTEIFWLDGRNYAPGVDAEYANEMTLRHAVIAADGGTGVETRLDARVCDCCQTGAAHTASGAVVVYRDRSDDEVRDIHIIRRTGSVWSEPAAVHEDGWKIAACPVNGPSVSAHEDRLAVAWFTAARDTPRVNIVFSQDGGRTFGTATRVDGGSPEGRVDVELLNDGSALVTWIERTSGGAEIRLRTVAPDGRMGPAVTAATASADRAAGFPRVAVSGGFAVLAWTEPGEPGRVRVARARVDPAD